MDMEKVVIEFYECETGGDLNFYESDIVECGGQITESKLNDDGFTGTIYFDVEDKNAFMEKFQETDAYGFIN